VNRVREYHAHELGRGSPKIFVDFDNAEVDLNEESRQSAGGNPPEREGGAKGPERANESMFLTKLCELCLFTYALIVQRAQLRALFEDATWDVCYFILMVSPAGPNVRLAPRDVERRFIITPSELRIVMPPVPPARVNPASAAA
jgi:hypothetical protein